jgi:hypothetical protein
VWLRALGGAEGERRAHLQSLDLCLEGVHSEDRRAEMLNSNARTVVRRMERTQNRTLSGAVIVGARGGVAWVLRDYDCSQLRHVELLVRLCQDAPDELGITVDCGETDGWRRGRRACRGIVKGRDVRDGSSATKVNKTLQAL